MARKTVALGLIAGLLALAGCNTISGIGKDVSSVGNATTKAAEKSK